MTMQEVNELIEKSRKRVQDMKEKNICTRESDVLAVLKFEESDPE